MRATAYTMPLCYAGVHICMLILAVCSYSLLDLGSRTASSSTCCCLQALMRLCEQTECDVRSCLNTLQFLARKGRPIKVADLNGLSIGQKDISKGAFSIWQDLLQIKVTSRNLVKPGFLM